MKLRVAITDTEWFEYLRRRPDLDEVNFWQPGGRRRFRALDLGEPFLFKLRAPLDYIVGGGFLAHFTIIPCSKAWEAFGPKNGADSFPEMRKRIEKHRRIPPGPREDYTIGCIILAEPFFLNEEEWIPVPADFSKNIQQGKNYDMTTPPGNQLWEAVHRTLPASYRVGVGGEVEWSFGARKQRLGQAAFQMRVLDAYQRHCAITREKALPVLEAVHIRPITQNGRHEISNGLLLRRDLHSLFDQGYLTVRSDMRLSVSRKLKADFDDGEYYGTFDRIPLWLPAKSLDRPDRDVLEWHADTVFKG